MSNVITLKGDRMAKDFMEDWTSKFSPATQRRIWEGRAEARLQLAQQTVDDAEQRKHLAFANFYERKAQEVKL